MTITVRNEADIIEDNLRYHLGAGVDFILATDHRSDDGTTEILQRYEDEGRLHLHREEGEAFRQTEWVTDMARLAATRFGADWVINTDTDEFWFARGGTLREVFAAVPPGYGAVRGIWRHFALRPDDDDPFYERMIVRRAPAHDPADPYCANAKVAHRANGRVRVGRGNHDVEGDGLALLRDWVAFEILHFPIRSRNHLLGKYSRTLAGHRLAGGDLVPSHVARLAQSVQADPEELYRELLVDDEAMERGIAAGLLAIDTRLRDTLHGGSVRSSSPAEDVAFAEEIDAMLAMDSAVRLAERVGAFERRLAAVESKRGG
ncbi:MAG: glycosyltransferase family 2 protein [Actinobacteria bacterium]|nr:glycosyltransferase family 2 protein [Actinomycetota bacterium]